MDHDHHHGSSEMEMAIERQLNTVVGANLFAEQPPYLNSFFRFQLGSNTFDGVSLPLSLLPARCTCAGTCTLSAWCCSIRKKWKQAIAKHERTRTVQGVSGLEGERCLCRLLQCPWYSWKTGSGAKGVMTPRTSASS